MYTDFSAKHFRKIFRDVQYRETALSLEADVFGEKLITGGIYLLEIKTESAMPLCLSHALDENKIYPTSFSEYGTACLKTLHENRISVKKKGEFIYA